jgi:hypothetical protein
MASVLAALLMAITLAHAQPVWVDCNHAHDIRPAGITLACGDGNFWVNRLDWTSWGRKSATAVGVGHLNDCKPYCAAGHFHAYRISIRLSKVVACGGRPKFARISWTWSRPKPAWRGKTDWNGSETLPCRWLRQKP